MTVVLSAIKSNDVVRPHATGDKWMVYGKITMSSTYKTGGDITLKEELEKVFKELGLGETEIDWVDISGDTGGYVLFYNYETNKLMVRRTGAATKGVFEELPEEEYPAAIRGANVHVMAICS